MNKIVLSLGAVVALSSFSVAGGDVVPVVPMYMDSDESSFYVGIGVSAVSARSSNSKGNIGGAKDGQDRLGNVTLLGGYNINRYFAVEGRYTTSFADEDKHTMDGLSIYAKPQYPINENFSVYALLGYGSVKFDAINDAIISVDDSGFQWGLGLNYEVANNMAIFIDYTFLASDMEGTYIGGSTEVDTDSLTVGVSYKF